MPRKQRRKTNRERAIHNRNLSDAAMSSFLQMLKYKCEWYGIDCRTIGQYQASTSVCSKCGTKVPRIATNIRRWACPNCLALHDRDVNAAKVIEALAFAGAE